MKLYQRGEIWWVTYGTKPQRRVSTKLRDKAAAMEYALRIVAPAMTDDAAALVEKAAQLRRSASEQRSDFKRLETLFQEDVYQRLHGCKPSSVRSAGDYWRSFVSFCAAHDVSDVGGLTPELCQEFTAGRAPRSAQCATIYCRQILRDGGCTRELFRSVPKRGEATHREPLTPDEIRAFLAEVDRLAMLPKSHRSISGEFPQYVRMLLYTGLRMGDAATMTVGMYDRETGCVRRTMAKTSRVVEFPVHKALRVFLDARASAAMDGNEPFFPTIAGIYRHDRHVISRHFSRVMARIGLKGKAGQYCAHCLRATFATLCAEHGIPLAVIQSWLGHTSPMVTRIYARIEDMKRKREALSHFPDLG